jgi:hypothetical protein
MSGSHEAVATEEILGRRRFLGIDFLKFLQPTAKKLVLMKI